MSHSKRENSDQIYYEQESQQQKKKPVQQSNHEYNHSKDYITLKTKIPKGKTECNEGILEYYTTQKYNEYFLSLSSKKPNHEKQKKKSKINLDAIEEKELNQIFPTGRNICVFGYGSKIQLLRQLQRDHCKQYHCLIIKAYLPSMSVKKIFNHFGGFLIDLNLIDTIDAVDFDHQAARYKQILSGYGNIRVVVFLHSIDGPSLMNPQSQERLANLFDSPYIQLVTSLDSFKMTMNWSPITLQKYRFCFFNVNTNEPYIEQFKYRPLKNQNRQSTEQSFKYIWQSLNKNQKQIVKFIAQKQLDNIVLDYISRTHYTLNELLDICIEQIVLSNQYQLRQNLLQLVDHKVIMESHDQKKNKRIYMMNYQKRMFEMILELSIE